MKSPLLQHRLGLALGCASVALLLAACSSYPPEYQIATPAADQRKAIVPSELNDPMEPLNRAMWVVNRGLLEGVVRPTSQVYRFVVPKPARTAVSNFSRNLMYPGRVANQLLQGRWNDAGDESLRFLTNTTVGVGGLFDPASRWDIPKPEGDFAGTFMHWGWQPESYLMLPVFGPSSEVHALGLAADELTEPWNYDVTLRRISYFSTFNRLSGSAEEASRFIRSEADAYATTRLLWSYALRNDPPDWTPLGPPDVPTLQTLEVATYRPQVREFFARGVEMRTSLPSTGKRLPFTCWLNSPGAPLVYIAPGLGSHRYSLTTIALAEGIYQKGFSVVVVSSVFHPEFMENASIAVLPAHLPADTADLLAAFTGIDGALERRFPGRFGSRALVGCSLGAYHALWLAARESSAAPGSIKFERYIGINPPVDLHVGVKQLDDFHDAPLAWPADLRQARVDNTTLKAGVLALAPPAINGQPPFDAVESKYIIGLSFRLMLRDAIYNIESRHNLGLVKSPLSKWNRRQAYAEIMEISYHDYITRYVFPHFQSRGVEQAEFKHYSTLRNAGPALRANPKVRLMTNRNDFLLAPGDLTWMRTTLGDSRVCILPKGGHLGNLASPTLRDALGKFLDGL